MCAKFVVAVETHRHKSIGPILRCAAAFGVTELYIVGSNQYSTHGAHGAQNHLQVWHFFYWNECLDFIKSRYNDNIGIYSISPLRLCIESTENVDGIETLQSIQSNFQRNTNLESITSTSVAHADFSSHLNACFIIGEKDGLSLEQLSICDKVLHVEFKGMTSGSEVLIGYDSKISICLQQFCVHKSLSSRRKDRELEKHELGIVDKDHIKTVRYAQKSLKQYSREDCDFEGLNRLFS